MNAPPSEQGRRGASGPSGGINSLVFFGAIVLLVGTAGAIGVAVWGPEKEVPSRSHLATDPQPPDSLPGFPADPPASASAVATEAVVDPPPVATDSADPAGDPPKKGKKRSGKGGGKRH